MFNEDEDDGIDDMDGMFEEKEPDANATVTERPSRGLGMMSRFYTILVQTVDGNFDRSVARLLAEKVQEENEGAQDKAGTTLLIGRSLFLS
jgi:hypothetical protein